jgi:hypothetical protein
MGVKPRFLLSLSCHFKQVGDERDLPQDVLSWLLSTSVRKKVSSFAFQTVS